jgi:NADH:ubiquinone oxidoreductase subunit 3 (subunit A)
MDDYAGILGLFCVGSIVAGVLALFHVRVGARRPPSRDADGSDPDHDAAQVARGLARFYLLSVLFVAFGLVALLLAPWAASFTAYGREGLGVATLFALPLLVGFVHVWAKGGLDW